MSGLQLFRGQEAFRLRETDYRLLPFRFMRWSSAEVLLVNDVGEYLFLDRVRFEDLLAHRLEGSCPEYADLEAKHFLANGILDLPIELLATKYRTKKCFLDGFTNLHLFVVTLRCDHTCRYCQVSRVTADRSRFDMSRETAERAIDLVFRSPARGTQDRVPGRGVPAQLRSHPLHRRGGSKRRNADHGKDVEFVVATNLSPLTDEILKFLRRTRDPGLDLTRRPRLRTQCQPSSPRSG